MIKAWTPEEDRLIRCLIARGPAVKGAWAALGPILGRSEASCYARARHLRNAAGLHTKGIGANNGQAKRVKKLICDPNKLEPSPSFRRSWFARWRKH